MRLHRWGDGEPLLLIHGIGSSWRCWQPVAAALAAEHEVIAIDLPGFGESSPLPAGVERTVPALVEAVEDQLDRLGIDSAYIAGNSMGGWISLELARRGRARSVCAISPAGLGTPAENRSSRRRLLAVRALSRGLRPVASAASGPVLARAALYALLAGYPWRIDPGELAHAVRAMAGAPGFRATLDWLFTHNVEGLEDISCPVTVLWGSRDAILNPRQGPRFAERIPNARHHALPHLGHIPMSDEPDLVARSILDACVGTQATAKPRTGALR